MGGRGSKSSRAGAGAAAGTAAAGGGPGAAAADQAEAAAAEAEADLAKLGQNGPGNRFVAANAMEPTLSRVKGAADRASVASTETLRARSQARTAAKENPNPANAKNLEQAQSNHARASAAAERASQTYRRLRDSARSAGFSV